MVLLAGAAQGGKAGGQSLLGGVDVEVHRNYFGSQLASFEAPLELAPGAAGARHFARDAATGAPGYTGVFIRAPAILTAGAGATPLAWVRAPRQDAHVPLLPSAAAAAAGASSSTADRVIVAVQQGPFLVTAFHPELTADHAWHALFVEQVEAATGKTLRTGSPAAAGGGGAPATAAALYADRSLTPGTSALSSFKNAGAAGTAAGTGSGRGSGATGVAAAGPGAPVLPQPVGLVGTDEGTCGHAKSHAIAHRVILYPPVSR
jgi:glutamine amidotransferase PdxT